MGQNLTRKILADHLVSGELEPGAEIADAPFKLDAAVERLRIDVVERHKESRSSADVDAALGGLRQVAAGSDGNLLPHMIAALDSGATLGEITRSLAAEFGEYHDA